MRKGDASFFKNGTVGQQSRAAAAPFRALPFVGNKWFGSILLGEFMAKGVLQGAQVGFDGGDVR